MDRYTHLGMVDMVAALDKLPTIGAAGDGREKNVARATGTNGRGVPSLVPSGAENGAKRAASPALQIAPDCTEEDLTSDGEKKNPVATIRQGGRSLCRDPHRSAPDCIADRCGPIGARTTGLEPATTGSTGLSSAFCFRPESSWFPAS